MKDNITQKNKINVTTLAKISLLAAIEIVLAFTPIGYIPFLPMRVTTLHIPVIIGGILLGPAAGAVLGAVFGLTSIIINTITPTITSFVFSPFYSGAARGNFSSVIIAMAPRILIGVAAAGVFSLMRSFRATKPFSYLIAGVAGSLTNTILVMSGIYLFFGRSYSEARGIEYGTLFSVIIGIIGTNGIPEAIAAAILAMAICKPILEKLLKPKHPQ